MVAVDEKYVDRPAFENTTQCSNRCRRVGVAQNRRDLLIHIDAHDSCAGCGQPKPVGSSAFSCTDFDDDARLHATDKAQQLGKLGWFLSRSAKKGLTRKLAAGSEREG